MPSGRIIQLPEAVANQIAAGEVVERPVAVIKELVENSLDAGARNIEVHFEQGGKTAMRVIDDGHGMTPDDAGMALKRHATSKIKRVEDILEVGTFGFRGEALPSIASVSRFNLRTRTRQAEAGTEILIDGGKEIGQRACGMPPGTEIAVNDLFFNVPARRKFLKTERTEAAHIIQTIRLLAIAHPETGFSLLEDGHLVFRSPGCPNRKQRIREIFGKRRADELFEIDASSDGLHLYGMMGLPGIGRNTRAELATYVNRRPVDSRLLSYALIETYHRYLPRGRYPVGYFFLDLQGNEVDVNVHPAKREVRFRNELKIRQVVMTELARQLATAAQPLQGEMTRVVPIAPPPQADSGPLAAPVSPPTGTAAATSMPGGARGEPPRVAWHPSPTVPGASAPAPNRQQGKWRFIGMLHQSIGLFEASDSLILMNAMAARERIRLEEIERSLAASGSIGQPLLIPALLELPPLEAGLLGDQIAFFAQIGFEVEPFGRHAYRLHTAPAWLGKESAESFTEDLVAMIRDRGFNPSDLQAARKVIARMAAMRGKSIEAVPDAAEWDRMAKALLACENPLLDARGRPTFIEIRDSELKRRLAIT